MKKTIDVSQLASTLRGESVFFPEKNGKPAPDQAGEPIENSALARKHQTIEPVNESLRTTPFDCYHQNSLAHPDFV
jgi:hypothetical protein